jgi:cephalosporin-C deacetylase
MFRGIDYLLTRPDVDPNRIGLIGTSQGGGMVLAAGGIDQRVKAVVSHLPYFCDARHNPVFLTQDLGRDPKFLDTFDYFDPIHLAPRLRAPTLISAGGKDKTCPPESIRAVFDRLPGIKALAHYPELTHTSCGDFYEMSWEWMNRYLKA